MRFEFNIRHVEPAKIPMLPTYYDFIGGARSFVVELAEQDAQDLRALTAPPETIHSVDDYDSRFQQCLERVDRRLIEDTARQAGLSIEDILPHFEAALSQSRAAASALYQTVNLEYHCLVNFALSGKKTFHFGDNLAEHLAHTEINVKAALIKLPFPSCLFVFSSSAVINAMHNIRGEEGRLAVSNNGVDTTAPVSVFLTEHTDRATFAGRKLTICAWHARQPNKVFLALKREIHLADSWSLDQALRTEWASIAPETLGQGRSIDVEQGTIEPQNDDAFYTDGLAFFRIVLNAILYLASDTPELVPVVSPREKIQKAAEALASPQKKRKLLQTANRYSALDYSDVGPTVGHIDVTRHEPNPEGVSGTGSKPLVRFMVRGHWRDQRCGQGNQSRKLVWIRPYYKGADLATTINKPYLVT